MSGYQVFPRAGRNGEVAIGPTIKERPPRDGNGRFPRGAPAKISSEHAVTKHDRKALEARLQPPAKSYRSWPRPIPRIPALRLSAPSGLSSTKDCGALSSSSSARTISLIHLPRGARGGYVSRAKRRH